jgi:hypothetical protein
LLGRNSKKQTNKKPKQGNPGASLTLHPWMERLQVEQHLKTSKPCVLCFLYSLVIKKCAERADFEEVPNSFPDDLLVLLKS